MGIVKIEHVQQLTGTDCGLACLAMVSGIPIAELTSHYDATHGMSKEEMCQALHDLRVKFRVKRYNTTEFGHVYIATVASLNKRGGMHYVVIDWRSYDGLLFDPLDGVEGKQCYKGLSDLPTWADLIEVTPVQREHS